MILQEMDVNMVLKVGYPYIKPRKVEENLK